MLGLPTQTTQSISVRVDPRWTAGQGAIMSRSPTAGDDLAGWPGLRGRENALAPKGAQEGPACGNMPCSSTDGRAWWRCR